MPESESDHESESGVVRVDKKSENDNESESSEVDREFNNESDGREEMETDWQDGT